MNKDVLTVLQEDFNVCKKFIQKVAKTLLNEEVSKYPIFVAVFEDQDIDLGIPILRREEIGSAFTFNASHLEEFANKGLVLEDKQAKHFEKTSKTLLSNVAFSLQQPKNQALCFFLMKRKWFGNRLIENN
jgi:hypothetical protein